MKTKVITKRFGRNIVTELTAAVSLSVSHDTPRVNMNRVKKLLANRSIT